MKTRECKIMNFDLGLAISDIALTPNSGVPNLARKMALNDRND